GARAGAHRLPAMVAAGLLQAEVLLEALAGAIAPVVEVARDDDWRVPGHLAIEAIDDRADLVAPAALVQREVHADAVQGLRDLRQLDLAVKHAATLQGVVRDVLVLGAQDGIAAEDRVAVVDGGVGGV